jgi:hypothetical protein
MPTPGGWASPGIYGHLRSGSPRGGERLRDATSASGHAGDSGWDRHRLLPARDPDRDRVLPGRSPPEGVAVGAGPRRHDPGRWCSARSLRILERLIADSSTNVANRPRVSETKPFRPRPVGIPPTSSSPPSEARPAGKGRPAPGGSGRRTGARPGRPGGRAGDALGGGAGLAGGPGAGDGSVHLGPRLGKGSLGNSASKSRDSASLRRLCGSSLPG